MNDPKIAPCYLCARAPVPAVIVWKRLHGNEERRPGICDECKRVHLMDSNPN